MILRSLEDSRRLARDLLERLGPGSLLLLKGGMGAGKTTLVSLLAAELDSEASVSSPTYTLIHEYPTPEGKLVHIDAWRLDSAADLLDSGLDDYLADSRLVAVEWGEDLLQQFPQATLLELELLPDENRRARLVLPE